MIRENGHVDLRFQRVPTPAFFYRLDPTGGVRRGAEMFAPWVESKVPRWNPATGDPLAVVGYHEAARSTLAASAVGRA